MVVESRRERPAGSRDGHDGDGRRTLDYEELDALLAAADKSLKKCDLHSANESLKRASVKAATMWGGTGVPALPDHARALAGLLSEVQRNISVSGGDRSEVLLAQLSGLRARFDTEAREEA